MILMSDSFSEMVERYRKELAQYGTAKLAAAQPEPSPVIPELSSPAVPQEPGSVIPEQSLPAVPQEPGSVIPEQNSNDFRAKLCHPGDTDTATLVVQVSTARQAVPVPGAYVSVFCGEDESKVLIAFHPTDESGKTDAMLLAAPDRALSQTPNSPSLPYSLYKVRVDHPGFVSVTLENVQLFGGVETILPVDLVPYVPVDEPKPLRTISFPEHSGPDGAETEVSKV
jgi:hypothetical protein